MARHALEHDDGAIIGYEWVPAWMHDNPIYFWSENSVRAIISRVRSERRPRTIAHHGKATP